MKKAWKIASVVVVVLVASLAGFFYWATWEGSTKEIVAVADKFQPESSWRQVTNQVVPPRTTCLEANCPSVHRVWEMKEIPTKQELEKLLINAGWEFEIEGDCIPSPYVSGSGGSTRCHARGVDEGYEINMYMSASYNGSTVPKVALSIDKVHD